MLDPKREKLDQKSSCGVFRSFWFRSHESNRNANRNACSVSCSHLVDLLETVHVGTREDSFRDGAGAHGAVMP